MTGSPVGGTGYSSWVNDLWLIGLVIVFIVGGIAAFIDHFRNK